MWFRGSRKNPTFRQEGGLQKTNIEGGLPKNGGVRQLPDLMGGLARKKGGVIPQLSIYFYT